MKTYCRTDDEWCAKLPHDVYRILRKKGTEFAFSGSLLYEKRDGTYSCAGCGSVLFNSHAKYDSGTGWPSFRAPANPDAVRTGIDVGFGRKRLELKCATCEGHLGHVFDDGPAPAGLRYCVNSAALSFKPARPQAARVLETMRQLLDRPD